MQIAVVDDASTDVDVRRLVEQIAGDRVEYHRQSQNVGSVQNFNTSIGLSRGRLVHLLHADDRVLPGYYEKMEALFASYPQAGARLLGLEIHRRRRSSHERRIELCTRRMRPRELAPHDCHGLNGAQYVATAVRRSVYEELGGYFGVSYGEDWEMQVRIASRYPVAYTPDILAEYRTHAGSISRDKIRAGDNLADMAWVVDTIQGYLPDSERNELRSQAETNCARLALHYAGRLWHFEGDSEASNRQLDGALRLSDDNEIRRGAEALRAAMATGERNPS